MSTQILKSGIIYKVNDLIPIHRANDGYEDNAMVVPDGEKWVKVKCNDGIYAFNKEQFESDLYLATDIDNSEVYVHEYYSDYISGRGANGNLIRFTCEQAARNHDFDFSVRLGRWHDKKCVSFYGDEIRMDYHDRRIQNNGKHKDLQVPTYINDNDDFIFGIEVEKVDSDLLEDGKAFELYHETGWRKEYDGSLNSGGYELVSPLLPLYDMQRIEQACEPVKKYINAKGDNSCGGHVNLSRNGMDSRTLLKGMKGFAPILYALYHNRLENRFCKARKWNHYLINPDKYSAFYVKDSKIVEVRLFSRVPNYNVMKWRVRLMQTLLKDFGRNLNQFVLKISSDENELYKLMLEQYSLSAIEKKIQLIEKYAELYDCGTISNSVRDKVNKRFGKILLPLK
jgi:hypothetical protein